METLVIKIPGQPSRVTHQSGTRISGHRTFKTKELLEWEKRLAKGLASSRPDQPIESPVKLEVIFGYRASRKNKTGNWKVTRPDTDNSIKTIKDMMTRLGYWKDDSQVAYEICIKVWTDDPAVIITVDELPKSVSEWEGE